MYTNMKNQKIAKKFILKNKKWNYRGEGNANLVLALVRERKILRLKKSLKNEKAKTEEDRVWRELDFCKRIMLPLLGPRFVPVPTIVRLQPQELTELNDALINLRPLHRHDKGLYVKYAALFTDLCLLPNSFVSYWAPTYCVEIKPKQGWVPFPDRRLQKCTFCLNQYSKFKQGIIKEISQYCPLDLFSGNVVRMKRAIVSMLKSPQNNLKMFKNGTLVFGDTIREQYEVVLKDWFGCYDIDILIDNFTKIVLGALTNDFSETDYQNVHSETPFTVFNTEREMSSKSCSSHIPKYLLDEARSLLPTSTCYSDSETLPKNCILSRILQVQKLDVLGSDAIYQLYSNLLYKEDYTYVYDLFRSFHNIYKPINSYLLATTAKDCSVLISFKKMPVSLINYECNIRDLNDVNYAVNVGVSDLDPKPMSCIEKHRMRDYEAIINCIDVLRSDFGINSILYQRGIYPQETFESTQQYGLTILTTTDCKIKAFLNSILEKTKEWLIARKIKKISLIIKNISNNETVECWDFAVEYEKGTSTLKKGLDIPLQSIENKISVDELPDTGTKDLKEIQREIRDVMLQICSTVSFLPLIDCLCSFDILVYTFKDCEVPDEWNESEPCYIANCQQVKFKPFSTSLHRMDTAVTYKADF